MSKVDTKNGQHFWQLRGVPSLLGKTWPETLDSPLGVESKCEIRR